MDIFVNHIDAIGFAAGALTTASFFPQVVRTWRVGGEDLSYAMLGLFLAGVLLWLTFGILAGSLPIVATNVLTALQVLVIVALKRAGRGTIPEAR